MNKKTATITILLALLAALFIGWAFPAKYSGAAMLMAALSCALYGACVVRLVNSLFAGPEKALGREAQGARSERAAYRHPWAAIAIGVLALHALLYALGYAVDAAQNGYTGGILDGLRRLWLRADAPHYLGIAENWYVTEGDPRFHIVFFPLYPIFIAIARVFTGESFAAAMAVSNLASVGAGILLYELAALDMERRDALFVTFILMLFPGAFFLAAPMSESLFLALGLAALLCARKQKYLLAGMFGAFAAFTRSAGVLLAVPIALEALDAARREGKLSLRAFLRPAIAVAITGLGTLAYLGVNLAVTGDAFTFMRYQSEHWNQNLGLFFSTAAYQTDYLLSNLASGDMQAALALFLPNILCCTASLGIMAAGRVRTSYMGYFLAYYAFSIGATWLLSGPRYLAVCFPVAFAAATAFKGRASRALLALVCAACMAIYLAFYVLGYPVY